jgi:hypothetical protein
MRANRRYHALRVKNRHLRRHFHVSRDSVTVPLARLLKIAPHWTQNEPKWWRKAMNIRPSRIESNRILARVALGLDPDLIRRWPDYRKPRPYYW